MPPRGARAGGARFLDVRVALFWLGAAVWLTGLALGLRLLTGVAIGILFAALVLGLIARRSEDGEPPGEDAEEEEGPDG